MEFIRGGLRVVVDVLESESVSELQRSALQLQPAVSSRPPNLRPQSLLPAVPVLNPEVLLGHKGTSALLHPQQVGEGLTKHIEDQ
ncbi:hypothetical protein EYF80_024007 [Liparis tanakae]|uniref:Uncharacterized protein n=1 Tax=Liparis tanakae TaxID=230148 RepID=A0A4Z2HL88_9TELE|nr:hypothetical protein EYF80_024007 [Liparis tanakae]